MNGKSSRKGAVFVPLVIDLVISVAPLVVSLLLRATWFRLLLLQKMVDRSELYIKKYMQ